MQPAQAEARPAEVRSRRDWLLASLGLWVAAGILTGYLHWVELLVAQHIFGRMVWFSREFVWMSPIAYTLVMAPGAILLVALTTLVRRAWMLSVTVAALTVVGVFGLLLPYSQISRTASLILALGAGVTISRSVRARPDRWIAGGKRLAVICVGFVALTASLQRVLALRGGRPAATVASGDAPNTLLIILDTVRAASMGLYSPAEANTPFLTGWSPEATVFDWAFSPAPWTLPSHSSMFTGAYAGEQSGDWVVPMDDERLTIAEWFQRRGYHTAGFVGNMHYTSWDSGLNRGFQRYDDYVVGWGQLWRSTSYTQTAMFQQLRRARDVHAVIRAVRSPNLSIDIKHVFQPKRGDQVTDQFLAWHAEHRDRPFFAFLNYFDGHLPYYAPPEFHRFRSDSTRGGLNDYRAAIAFLDSEINRLLSALREREALDNTLVIVSSDHGELFAFKGLNGHAHNLYVNTIRVPLFIRFPGKVPAGQRVSTAVTLRDLPATIVDLVAGDTNLFPGASLAATWSGTPAHSPVLVEVSQGPNVDMSYPTSRGDMKSIIDDQWQLIRNGDGAWEFYEYRVDSLAERDHAATDSLSGIRDAVKSRLSELLRARR